MSTIELSAHISADGRVTVPPIPDWPGGEANTQIYVRLPETGEDSREKMPVRPRIVEQTPEERKVAFEDFMASWKGCLKGVPHMSAKEIRAERLEKKYGKRGSEE